MADAPPSRPSLATPAILIATWFGSGYLKPAPGSWGSLAALPFAYGLLGLGGALALSLATAAVFALGVWAAQGFDRLSQSHDSSEIVVDEVAGQWLTFALAAWTVGDLSLTHYIVGFFAFRLFDIAKPFPVGLLDRRVQGGLGVMLDDIAAGLYAGLTVILLEVAYARVVLSAA
ncbi:MAG: phosphatidylglycerophosphatase A [Alphaproteobacteria bacterium]|nr:phosphatidylglycerophosphatase A [Alphaproteobacteria bacterium]